MRLHQGTRIRLQQRPEAHHSQLVAATARCSSVLGVCLQLVLESDARDLVLATTVEHAPNPVRGRSAEDLLQRKRKLHMCTVVAAETPESGPCASMQLAALRAHTPAHLCSPDW